MAWMRKKGSTTQPQVSSQAEGNEVAEQMTEAQEARAATTDAQPAAASNGAAQPAQEGAPALPPFYAQPVVLMASQHGQWRLLPGGQGFASDSPSIPLVGADFANASRSYPILFAEGGAVPVALVGLEQRNLFVERRRWAEGAYVPAYVRRHPFIMVEAPGGTSAALAVDAASELISKNQGDGGEPLFDGTQPSAVTLRALEFCRLFSQDHARTRAFSKALMEEDLLIERRANVTLANGRQLAVTGFQVVDPQRFGQLPEEKVVIWHRNGWLALVHFHLASLERFSELLRRQNQRELAAA